MIHSKAVELPKERRFFLPLDNLYSKLSLVVVVWANHPLCGEFLKGSLHYNVRRGHEAHKVRLG